MYQPMFRDLQAILNVLYIRLALNIQRFTTGLSGGEQFRKLFTVIFSVHKDVMQEILLGASFSQAHLAYMRFLA